MKMNSQGGASVPASRGEKISKAARGDARPTKFVLPFLAAIILFAAFGAIAQTTNGPADAEIQGRNLAGLLLEQWPTTNFMQNGNLSIRDNHGGRFEAPIQFHIFITPPSWVSNYKIDVQSNLFELTVIHKPGGANEYHYHTEPRAHNSSNGNATMTSFASSDFWLADLGLEFLHWPGQKILKQEVRKTRSCNVLESTNPNPSANGYSRVVSWVDEESDGIVHAEAYDSKNKLLKVFDLKSIEKVNGQWQPELVEMDNVQTGSRTWIDFNPGPTLSPRSAGANSP
jgi:hypothetical protein